MKKRKNFNVDMFCLEIKYVGFNTQKNKNFSVHLFVFEKIKVVVSYDKQNKLQIMRTFIIEYLIMLALKIDKKRS